MATFAVASAIFLLLGLCSASIPDHCTDISYWDVLSYETTTKQCCDTKLKQVCTTKTDQVCQDVLELQCEVVAWGECKSTPTSIQSTKCDVKYNDFAHQNCKELAASVKHTKKVPECRVITKNNCVTDWDVDASGNKVWAGTETCTPVSWEECDIVEKTVEFPTVKTECNVDSDIKWADFVNATTNIIGLESKCEVKKAVNCKHVVTNKCAPVVWQECNMEPREECLAKVIHTPNQEKIHRKNCLAGDIDHAIDGGWTSYGSCTKTCKGGVKTRTCTNPSPQQGGKPCTGDASVPCNQNIDCAIDGGWTSYGSCTKTCKGGVKTRTCTNPSPQQGGKPCTGDASVPCNQNIDCVVNVIYPGTKIIVGTVITSTNGEYSCGMQRNGNFAITNRDDVVTWSTNTVGQDLYFEFRFDGTLGIYDQTGGSYWSAGTFGKGSGSLVLENTGFLVLYRLSGEVLWTSQHHKLLRGQTFKAGYSMGSSNGVYTLTMQDNGHLVLSSTHGSETWDIGTSGLGAGASLQFHSDGNLVLYGGDHVAKWDSGTGGSNAKALVLQDDGQLVLCCNEDGGELWIGVGNFIREGNYECIDGKEKSDSNYAEIKRWVVGRGSGIALSGSREIYKWINKAGEAWTLYPTDEINVLRVGEDSPHYASSNHRTAVFNAAGVSGPSGCFFVFRGGKAGPSPTEPESDEAGCLVAQLDVSTANAINNSPIGGVTVTLSQDGTGSGSVGAEEGEKMIKLSLSPDFTGAARVQQPTDLPNENRTSYKAKKMQKLRLLRKIFIKNKKTKKKNKKRFFASVLLKYPSKPNPRTPKKKNHFKGGQAMQSGTATPKRTQVSARSGSPQTEDVITMDQIIQNTHFKLPVGRPQVNEMYEIGAQLNVGIDLYEKDSIKKDCNEGQNSAKQYLNSINTQKPQVLLTTEYESMRNFDVKIVNKHNSESIEQNIDTFPVSDEITIETFIFGNGMGCECLSPPKRAKLEFTFTPVSEFVRSDVEKRLSLHEDFLNKHSMPTLKLIKKIENRIVTHLIQLHGIYLQISIFDKMAYIRFFGFGAKYYNLYGDEFRNRIEEHLQMPCVFSNEVPLLDQEYLRSRNTSPQNPQHSFLQFQKTLNIEFNKLSDAGVQSLLIFNASSSNESRSKIGTEYMFKSNLVSNEIVKICEESCYNNCPGISVKHDSIDAIPMLVELNPKEHKSIDSGKMKPTIVQQLGCVEKGSKRKGSVIIPRMIFLQKFLSDKEENVSLFVEDVLKLCQELKLTIKSEIDMEQESFPESDFITNLLLEASIQEDKNTERRNYFRALDVECNDGAFFKIIQVDPKVPKITLILNPVSEPGRKSLGGVIQLNKCVVTHLNLALDYKYCRLCWMARMTGDDINKYCFHQKIAKMILDKQVSEGVRTVLVNYNKMNKNVKQISENITSLVTKTEVTYYIVLESVKNVDRFIIVEKEHGNFLCHNSFSCYKGKQEKISPVCEHVKKIINFERTESDQQLTHNLAYSSDHESDFETYEETVETEEVLNELDGKLDFDRNQQVWTFDAKSKYQTNMSKSPEESYEYFDAIKTLTKVKQKVVHNTKITGLDGGKVKQNKQKYCDHCKPSLNLLKPKLIDAVVYSSIGPIIYAIEYWECPSCMKMANQEIGRVDAVFISTSYAISSEVLNNLREIILSSGTTFSAFMSVLNKRYEFVSNKTFSTLNSVSKLISTYFLFLVNKKIKYHMMCYFCRQLNLSGESESLIGDGTASGPRKSILERYHFTQIEEPELNFCRPMTHDKLRRSIVFDDKFSNNKMKKISKVFNTLIKLDPDDEINKEEVMENLKKLEENWAEKKHIFNFVNLAFETKEPIVRKLIIDLLKCFSDLNSVKSVISPEIEPLIDKLIVSKSEVNLIKNEALIQKIGHKSCIIGECLSNPETQKQTLYFLEQVSGLKKKIHKQDLDDVVLENGDVKFYPPKGYAYYFTENGHQVRKLGKYEADEKSEEKKADKSCLKKWAKAGRRNRSTLFCFFCSQHRQFLGMHIGVNEGRKDLVYPLLKFAKNAPKKLYFDFACDAESYAMNREPGFFADTTFKLEPVHGTTHKCPSQFHLTRQEFEDKSDNLSICEQVNKHTNQLRIIGTNLSVPCYMLVAQDMFHRYNAIAKENYIKKMNLISSMIET